MAGYVAATIAIQEPGDFRFTELKDGPVYVCSVSVGTSGVLLLTEAGADALAFALNARQAAAEIDARSAAYHEQQIDDAIDRLHEGGERDE